MEEYIVKYGQNIFDLAGQLYGTIDGVKYILRFNPSVTLDTDFRVGDVVYYDKQYTINAAVVSTFSEGDKIISNDAGNYSRQDAGGFDYIFDYKLS